MAHLHASRSRPEPLSLHHSHSNGSQQHAHGTSNDRARLLSSLRSAPIPHAYTHQTEEYQHRQQVHEQQQYANVPGDSLGGGQYDPRSAAYLQFQQAQTAYLAELQRQILVKQNEIWINQQQIEAEAALRQMNLEAEREREREREREWHAGMERERRRAEHELGSASRSNPLVASALARRKRQSLNFEARERQPTPPFSSSTVSHSPPPTANSSVRSTPPPPAVILSAPGEPYPDTSSASGSESDDVATRPSTPSSATDSPLSRLDRLLLQEEEHAELLHREQEQREREEALLLDQEMKASRRRTSHLDTLSNALGARQKRRPASMGGGSPLLLSASSPASSSSPRFSPRSPDLATPRPHQVSFGLPYSADSPRGSPRLPGGVSSGYTPRSVSESHAQQHHLLRSPATAAAMTSPSFSTSNALPNSPGQQFVPTVPYVSAKPAVLPGHAFAVRQPRGPPTNLALSNVTSAIEGGSGGRGGGEETNFGTRIRQKAIENLRGLSNGRTNRVVGGTLRGEETAGEVV